MLSLEEAKARTLMQSNLPNLADALYFHFDRTAEDILKTILLQNQGIVALRLQSSAPKAHSVSFAADPNLSFEDLKKREGIHPILFSVKKDKEPLATVEALYQPSLSKRYFETYRFTALVSTLLLFTLFVGATSYIYMKIRAFYLLGRKLESIDPIHVKTIEPVDSYSEIESITNAVNRLFSKISDYARALRENKRHLMEAQKIAHVGSWEYNLREKTFVASDELYRILGIDRHEEKIGLVRLMHLIAPDERKPFLQKLKTAIKAGGRFEVIHKTHTATGKVKYLKTIVKVRYRKGGAGKVMGISMDVTEEINAKKHADHLALHDPLTGLLNRRAFIENINFAFKIAERHNNMFAILFIDLDNFKPVNDSFGHETGDALLQKIAQILTNDVRQSDVIARIGGDEFVALLNDISSIENVENVINKLIADISRTHKIHQHKIEVTASIGAAIYPLHGKDTESLLRNADAAMYEAKRRGKNRYLIFNDSIQKRLNDRMLVVEEIKTALAQEEIELFFQPQIDMKSGKVKGAEVLTRWNHPKKGLIFPGDYIPIIEETDLMIEYDHYVAKKTCEVLKEWSKSSFSGLTLSINLSARHFNSRDLQLKMRQALKEHGIPAEKIELEITETLSMEDVDFAISILQNLKDIGYAIAIDDFGTGYSSLNYLKKLPFDYLKIDRGFITDIDKFDDNATIVKLIIQMAHTLGKKVIAEGPEKEEHIHLLKALGCDYGQGYYYAKPMNREMFEKYVTSALT